MYGQRFQQSTIWINLVSLPVLLVESEEVILRRANCPCCSRITYSCVQENCRIVQDHSLLLHFVLLLYCTTHLHLIGF